jgi:hypothetical protein
MGRIMTWKAIGQSVIGTSHVAENKGCEDAILFKTVVTANNEEVLVGFVSDGAGSAKYAACASKTSVAVAISKVDQWICEDVDIQENHLIQLAELIYDELKAEADAAGEPIDEYSCTLLGVIIFSGKACYMQIGDGAIVRNTGDDYYSHVWWPHNGEYQNTTSFLVDDASLKNLKTKVVDEAVKEIAVFTDGLQMLALNNELETVHQPFFNNLFSALRVANSEEQVAVLGDRLVAYLSGDTINSRTDDDKTLLLATKMVRGNAVV